MKAFLAIIAQTVRSAVRAKVFHILFVLVLLAVFLLPMTVSGDGTLMGLVQISLTYSLGIVVALISTTTLWLSCSQLSREIESYNIHFVLSKPVSRAMVWFGKWCGIFLMHTLILLISALLIFALIQFRVKYETSRGRFTQAEVDKLDKELRVGRRAFLPEPVNYEQQVSEEYKKDFEQYKSQSEESAKNSIRAKLRQKDGEVVPAGVKTWTFKNVTKDSDILFLRYRVYSGGTQANSQKNIPAFWGIKDPSAPAGVTDPFSIFPSYVMSGTFQEIKLTPNCIDTNNGNTVTLRFYNPPKGSEFWRGTEAASAIFQPADGPAILVAVSSFESNYSRAILLAIFQIAFLAALGCTVSAAFSTPVAAFVAVTYLVIGLSVQAAIDAPIPNGDGTFMYQHFYDKPLHLFAIGMGKLVVSVNDLDATSDLASGRLVEGKRLLDSFLWLLIFKTGLISLIGVWILNKRELGAVIRK